MGVDELISGREAFDRRQWLAAHDSLASADEPHLLTAEDLSRWATSAYLLGRPDECLSVLQRAYRAYEQAGDTAGTVRALFWLGFTALQAGEPAVAGGWLGRARRIVEENGDDLVERGYLLIARLFEEVMGGAIPEAHGTAAEIEMIGRRFADADLVAAGLHFRGRTMLHLDQVPDGLALMDEAMVGVTTGEVSPVVAGLVFCSLVEACQEISDLARAEQWTAALNRWCDDQPDLVAYTGQCAVHRGQILRLHGELAAALGELRLACSRYQQGGTPYAAGLALYEEGEVHRIRGDHADAQRAYEEAGSWGFEPQPGNALLWLAQGRTDAAAGAVRRLAAETRDVVRRSQVLPAAVEVLLAARDLEAARTLSDELGELSARFRCVAVGAQAAGARGAVLVAGGRPEQALPELRSAWRAWQSLEAPYEAARVRVSIGRACRALGDEDSARMEIEAARRVFVSLGTAPPAAEAAALLSRPAPDGLTAREVEVLRLVATGLSNHAIAERLFLSEKTVARHLSNIFTKIGVGTRTAAAAYAFERDLA